MFNNSEDWKDIIFLDDSYKRLIKNYFNNRSGKFIIDKNILYVDFDSWGIEKFYINNFESKKQFYDILYENFLKIYDIAVLIQIGNWETFKKMEVYLNNFDNININIYFTLIKEICNTLNIEYLKKKYKNSVILKAENKGMDIGLFLVNLHYIKSRKYNHDYLFKIHTKTNDEFRNKSLNNLMSSYDKIINNIKLISKEHIGTISGNIIYKYNEYKDPFRVNCYHLENIVKYLYNESIDYNKLEFSAGTMFIIKNNVLTILNIKNIEYLYSILNNSETLDYYWYSIFYNISINNKKNIYIDYTTNKNTRYPNNINYNLKTNKPGLRDSMVEHAMERLFGYICKKNNLSIV
jgi:hypothetical protein